MKELICDHRDFSVNYSKQYVQKKQPRACMAPETKTPDLVLSLH